MVESSQPRRRYIDSLTEDGRYRLLVEAVTDYAIYMLYPDGFITSWNLGARRFKGYEEAEIIGRHFSTFYTDEDRARGLPEKALSISAAEGKFESEGWRVRKDGSQFWASIIIDRYVTQTVSSWATLKLPVISLNGKPRNWCCAAARTSSGVLSKG